MTMEAIRVLLIDGSSMFLDLVASFLEQYDDITVVGTLTGDPENLAPANECRPEVIVIDLGTPGLVRLWAIGRLRTMMPEVPIIATSLLGAEGYRKAALLAGADDFVSKRNLRTELVAAIRSAARTGAIRHEN